MQTEEHVCLTGASGFIGEALAAELSSKGISGVAVSRRFLAKVPPLWSWMNRDAALAALKPPREIGCVIHLEVKQHIVQPTAENGAEFNAVNVEGTRRWLMWCTRHRVPRFVYFSSIKAVQPEQGGATDENASKCIGSSYGESKWAAEQSVRQWVAEESGRNALILRPAVVYGSGSVGNIGAMVTAIARNRFFLVGDNDNIKSMISVGNLTAAVLHLLPRMRDGKCEVYNLVDQESYTVRHIDMVIRCCLGKVGNSPTLPLALVRAVAKCGDALPRVGRRILSINTNRLNALLDHTHFSAQKLIDSGFVHPQTTEQGLANMVHHMCNTTRTAEQRR